MWPGQAFAWNKRRFGSTHVFPLGDAQSRSSSLSGQVNPLARVLAGRHAGAGQGSSWIRCDWAFGLFDPYPGFRTRARGSVPDCESLDPAIESVLVQHGWSLEHRQFAGPLSPKRQDQLRRRLRNLAVGPVSGCAHHEWDRARVLWDWRKRIFIFTRNICTGSTIHRVRCISDSGCSSVTVAQGGGPSESLKCTWLFEASSKSSCEGLLGAVGRNLRVSGLGGCDTPWQPTPTDLRCFPPRTVCPCGCVGPQAAAATAHLHATLLRKSACRLPCRAVPSQDKPQAQGRSTEGTQGFTDLACVSTTQKEFLSRPSSSEDRVFWQSVFWHPSPSFADDSSCWLRTRARRQQ